MKGVIMRNRKEYFKAYRQAHKDQAKVAKKAWYQAHKESVKAKTKAYYQTNKEKVKAYYHAHKDKRKPYYQAYMKAYYEAHKEQYKAKAKAYYEAHKEHLNAYAKNYKQSDVNSLGQTKHSIRKKSQRILKKMHLHIPGYQIHHCFTYDDASKFIYISKALHRKIHKFLRDNNIDADTDHWMQIREIVNSADEFMYIKC